MRKVIRLTERDLSRIIRRVISEDKSYLKTDEEVKNLTSQLDDIFFRNDEYNVSSNQGNKGYLSSDYVLDKKISPKQRAERIKQIIEVLYGYITDLETSLVSSQSYLTNPDYDSQWRDIERKR